MSMSTAQKVTLISCLVVCVTLLLPKMFFSKGRRDVGQQEAAPGRFPPMLHRQQKPVSQTKHSGVKSSNAEAPSKAKGSSAGGKSNLTGQIIPIYGFGILLYILYILFKITSKGKTVKPECRLPAKSEKAKITDYELVQLQEKLRETEEVMEKIVSNASRSEHRLSGIAVEHEETLLWQLKEITRVMQEGQLVEGAIPPYWDHKGEGLEDWDDEVVYDRYPESCCRHQCEGSRMAEKMCHPQTAGINTQQDVCAMRRRSRKEEE